MDIKVACTNDVVLKVLVLKLRNICNNWSRNVALSRNGRYTLTIIISRSGGSRMVNVSMIFSKNVDFNVSKCSANGLE